MLLKVRINQIVSPAWLLHGSEVCRDLIIEKTYVKGRDTQGEWCAACIGAGSSQLALE